MRRSRASQLPSPATTITLIEHSAGSFKLSYHDKEEKSGLERGIDVITDARPPMPKLKGVPWCSSFFFSFGVSRGDQGNQKGFSLILNDPFSL